MICADSKPWGNQLPGSCHDGSMHEPQSHTAEQKNPVDKMKHSYLQVIKVWTVLCN